MSTFLNEFSVIIVIIIIIIIMVYEKSDLIIKFLFYTI